MSILRDVLMDEAGDDGDKGGAPKVVAGPGETQDSMTDDLNPVKEGEDKGDTADEAKIAEAEAAEAAKKEAEAKDADDKKDADTKKDKSVSVPKFRMDAALARARKAEEEAAAARDALAAAQAAPTKPADDDEDTLTIAQAEKRVDALDGEIAKAMKDEDDEEGTKLAELLREQRELRDGIQEAKGVDARVEQSAQTAEEIQFDRVVTDLEGRIPALDPSHEDYSQELTDETVTLAKAMHGQGYTQGDSMLLAVDYMSEKLGIKGTDTVKTVKKETDIEKNVELAKKMPPDTPGAKGVASDQAGFSPESKNAMSMSDTEFEALRANPEELARLRGDFV